MKLIFATDHAGFELKESLIAYVRNAYPEYEIIDMGAVSYESEDDYPDIIRPAAREVSKDPNEVRAVILGGSGQGEAICANRFKGVRAAVYYGGPLDIVTLSREHNNANVLSLGARFLDEAEAIKAVDTWLGTDFSGVSRHMRRIAAIDKNS